MTYRALDIASWFIAENRNRHTEADLPLLSHGKLQALLVISQQGRFLMTGEPLFTDRIQRWKYGPLVPAVFRVIKEGRGVLPSVPELPRELDNFLFSTYECFAHEKPDYILAASKPLWEPLPEGAVLDPQQTTEALLEMFGRQGG